MGQGWDWDTYVPCLMFRPEKSLGWGLCPVSCPITKSNKDGTRNSHVEKLSEGWTSSRSPYGSLGFLMGLPFSFISLFSFPPSASQSRRRKTFVSSTSQSILCFPLLFCSLYQTCFCRLHHFISLSPFSLELFMHFPICCTPLSFFNAIGNDYSG